MKSFVATLVAIVFAEQGDTEERVPSTRSNAEEEKQFWIANRFRRPFPLRTRHKPILPRTVRTPQVARDAADRLLSGWNQGTESAILRLLATGAFVEDYSMLAQYVRSDFGASTNRNDYMAFWNGNYQHIQGFKNVSAYATAMSCMTRRDVITDDECCKLDAGHPDFTYFADMCTSYLFLSTEDQPNRVVETSFTATSDGFVGEYKYVIPAQNDLLEFDLAIKTTLDNYGRFRRLSVYSSYNSFNLILNDPDPEATVLLGIHNLEIESDLADICSLQTDPTFIQSLREAFSIVNDIPIESVVVESVEIAGCSGTRRLLGGSLTSRDTTVTNFIKGDSNLVGVTTNFDTTLNGVLADNYPDDIVRVKSYSGSYTTFNLLETKNPTVNPTVNPTTRNPTVNPTVNPTTVNPTVNPTTANPTTANPTANPTAPTPFVPTRYPTRAPTKFPTVAP